MGDDRPVEDQIAMLARIARDFDDHKTTVLARIARQPTGAMAITLRTAPQPGTLFAQGQSVSRAAYPVLWQWVQDEGMTSGTGRFGVGDGSTTFTLPNLQGRFLVGAGSLGGDSYTVGQTGGSTLKTLTTTELPTHSHTIGTGGSHEHNGTTGGGGQHSHSGNSDLDAGHGGHHPTSQAVAAAGVDLGLSPWNASGVYMNAHDHGFTTDTEPNHGHGFTTDNEPAHGHTAGGAGSGSPFDGRPTYYALNVEIWT